MVPGIGAIALCDFVIPNKEEEEEEEEEEGGRSIGCMDILAYKLAALDKLETSRLSLLISKCSLKVNVDIV